MLLLALLPALSAGCGIFCNLGGLRLDPIPYGSLPTQVIQTFSANFPGATNITVVKYSFYKEVGHYEFNFPKPSVFEDVTISAAGVLEDIWERVPPADLPPIIQNSFQGEYPGIHLERILKHSYRGWVISYQFEITNTKNPDDNYWVIVGFDGKVTPPNSARRP